MYASLKQRYQACSRIWHSFTKSYFLLPLVPFPSFSMLLNFWTILHTICSRIFSTITMKCGCNMSFARFDYYHIDVISHIFWSWWIFTSLHLLTAFFQKILIILDDICLCCCHFPYFKFCWFLPPNSIHAILTHTFWH